MVTTTERPAGARAIWGEASEGTPLLQDFERYLDRTRAFPKTRPGWFKGSEAEYRELIDLTEPVLRQHGAVSFLAALERGWRPWELGSGTPDGDCEGTLIVTGAPRRVPAAEISEALRAEAAAVRREGARLLDTVLDSHLAEAANGSGHPERVKEYIRSARAIIGGAKAEARAAVQASASLGRVRILTNQFRPGGRSFRVGDEVDVTADDLAAWKNVADGLNAARARQLRKPIDCFEVLRQPKGPASSAFGDNRQDIIPQPAAGPTRPA